MPTACKTRKLEIEVPEPCGDGGCRAACPLNSWPEHPCRFSRVSSIGVHAISRLQIPGPECPWGKEPLTEPSASTLHGTKVVMHFNARSRAMAKAKKKRKRKKIPRLTLADDMQMPRSYRRKRIGYGMD